MVNSTTATLDTQGNSVSLLQIIGGNTSGSPGEGRQRQSDAQQLRDLQRGHDRQRWNAYATRDGRWDRNCRRALTINSGATVGANTNWSLGYSNGTCVSGITINGGLLSFNGTSANGGSPPASSQ